MDNTYSWSDLESHIERREDGCWTWDGFALEGNVYRVIAEAYGAALPGGQKMYRMPGCTLGKDCVNPNHIGAREDFARALQGQRREIPASKTITLSELTVQDRRFLRSCRISWECVD